MASATPDRRGTTDMVEGSRTRALIRRRQRRRRSLAAATGVLVAAALAATAGLLYLQRGGPATPAADASASKSLAAAPSPEVPVPSAPPPSFPVSGPNTLAQPRGSAAV